MAGDRDAQFFLVTSEQAFDAATAEIDECVALFTVEPVVVRK
jgi:hypothetical protein